MEIIDANYILRYLLKDIEEQHQQAAIIIENKTIHIPGEIIAEVVYVLQKVYNIPNKDITTSLLSLIEYPNINIPEQEIIITALKLLTINKLDYADNLLLAFRKNKGVLVHTFDKKLIKALKRI